MKKIIAAASMTMVLATHAQAQSMTMSKVLDLASMIGMGVGIGEACQLDADPLKSGFERMTDAERFSELEKVALSKAFDAGLVAAHQQAFDASACVGVRQIWRDQVETLTLSMITARRR